MKYKNKKILRDYLIGWSIGTLLWLMLSNVNNAAHVAQFIPTFTFGEELIITCLFWMVQAVAFFLLHIFIDRFIVGRVPFIRLTLFTISIQTLISIFNILLVYICIKQYTDVADDIGIWYLFQMPLVHTAIIYALVVNFCISLSIQVSMILGDGKLFKIIIGTFYKPKIEELFFMFLDLKNSTGIAEKLKHTDYSKLLQDCFYDLAVVHKYKAEIFQYVGDEAVLVWKVKDGIKDMNCINAFYAFEERIEKRKSYYKMKYGLVPEFKAGLQVGEVTIAEVGELKRDIAFHGDTINTASRIQKQCNQLETNLLVPEQVLSMLDLPSDLCPTEMGQFHLKGKTKPVSLFTLERVIS